MVDTSPIASVWTPMSTRLCCLLLRPPGVVLSCQLVVASPLVIPSLRRPLVVLLRQLVVASPLSVLSLRCPLVILSHELVVALPFAVLSLRHPLVNLSHQLVVASSLLVPYVWPQLTTPKLRELRSQLLPMQFTPFLIFRSSSMRNLLLKIKNGVNCMGRSQERSSLNLEVGQWESCGYFHFSFFEILEVTRNSNYITNDTPMNETK